MGRWISKIKNKQYGQAMVEFALTLPIFLLLVFGVIELSRFFLVYSSVFTASREASRFGSSVGDFNNENFLNCEAIAQRAVFSGGFGGVQIDDVIIYYESTPGTIVASCPNTISGSIPLIGNCHDGSINCVDNPPSNFTPALGDRILVEIVTEFDSLLGIVPDLPVRAESGRTIMKQIKVFSTPVVVPTCNEAVSFVGNLVLIDDEEDNALSISIKNDSTLQHFRIDQILKIKWKDSDKDPVVPNLLSISLADKEIWRVGNSELQKYTEDTETYYKLTEWSSENTRNLPAKLNEDDVAVAVPLSFKFDGPINEILGFNFEFYLIVKNNSLPSDICDPVTIK